MTTEFKLSDVKVGTPRVPRSFNNETSQAEDLDPCDAFLDRLHDREKDWRTGATTQSLFLRHVGMPKDGSIYHRNYLEYLEKCWADHLGIVITPDVLWFTVLSELVGVVKESPEPYRHLFTRSHEKQEIWVEAAEEIVMPLNRLVQALRGAVPTEASLFLPQFSTTSERSRHAMYASFCDLCSPYYEYGMYACGFPAISVQGTRDDWHLVAAQWRKLVPLFGAAAPWMERVQRTLDECVARLVDATWWRAMFSLERCGSGSQTEISGWLPDLFRVQPEGPRYVQNFPTNVAVVDYKEKRPATRTLAGLFMPERVRRFRMQDGLFYSYQEGDFMVPDFGYAVHERTKPVVTEGDGDGLKVSVQRIETKTPKMAADWKVETTEDRILFHGDDE